MKDKLYKTNHKTMYYVGRKALLSLVLFLGLGVAVGIPTTINVLTSEPTQGLAEGNSSNSTSEDVESEDNSYLSYSEN